MHKNREFIIPKVGQRFMVKGWEFEVIGLKMWWGIVLVRRIIDIDKEPSELYLGNLIKQIDEPKDGDGLFYNL